MRSRKVLFAASFAVAIAAKLWLVKAQPLTAVPGGMQDDGLYFRSAQSIMQGQWLGPYDYATLIKGPFYPLWLAFVFRLGVPLLFAQQLLYAAACLLFIAAIKPLLKNPWIVLAAFVALLFNPGSYAWGSTTQMMREGIYPALTMVVMSCALAIVLRAEGSLKALLGWGGGLGLSLAAFWLTREEGLWIIPALLVIAAGSVFVVRGRAPRWRLLMPALVLPGLMAIFIVGGVAEINRQRYGFFGITELRTGAFPEAYNTILSVDHRSRMPTVPVPKEVIEKLYAVSPSFAVLRPYLEGEIGEARRKGFMTVREYAEKDPFVRHKLDEYLSVDVTGIWRAALDDDGEMHGDGFFWALRDAAASAGKHGSAAQAAEFYGRITAEVREACAAGKLTCGDRGMMVLQAWRAVRIPALLKTMARGFLFLARFEDFEVFILPSMGDDQSLDVVRSLARTRLAPSRFEVKGWIVSPRDGLSITVRTGLGSILAAAEMNLPSPDIPEATNARFQVTGPMGGKMGLYSESCYLEVARGDRVISRLPLDGSVRSVHRDDLRLALEEFGPVNGPSGLDRKKLKALELLGQSYGVAVPVVLLCLLALPLAAVIMRRRIEVSAAPVIAIAGLAFAIVGRIGLLSLMHAGFYPTFFFRWYAPLHPLLLMLIVITAQVLRGSFAKGSVGTPTSPINDLP